MKKDGFLTCSFCGVGDNNCEVIIVGPEVNICDRCVLICAEIVIEGKKQRAKEIKPERFSINAP